MDAPAPPKREGALQAPIPKLDWTETTAAPARLQACKHRATVTQQEPLGATHFSREICLECRAFVRWLPKPSTIKRQKLNAFSLARLGMCDGLSKWERGFVRSVSEKKYLSPKQLEIIAELVAKHLEGKAQ